jgi:hypothetical protein
MMMKKMKPTKEDKESNEISIKTLYLGLIFLLNI